MNYFFIKSFASETLILLISMSLILKCFESFINIVIAGISAPLSSFNVLIVLFLAAFLVAFFFSLSYSTSFFIIRVRKKLKNFYNNLEYFVHNFIYPCNHLMLSTFFSNLFIIKSLLNTIKIFGLYLFFKFIVRSLIFSL